MGLIPDQLYDLTFREFSHKIEGFNEIERARNEIVFRSNMEASRLNAAALISAFSGKLVPPQKLIPFEWDTETKTKVEPMNRKKFQKLKKYINSI